MNAWVLLILAGTTEIAWALGLPATKGFTRLWPSVLVIAGMCLSFYLLAAATKTLPIAIAYPVWVGIGAAGTFLLGSLIQGEAIRWSQALWVAILIGAIVGLKRSAAVSTRGVDAVRSADRPPSI